MHPLNAATPTLEAAWSNSGGASLSAPVAATFEEAHDLAGEASRLLPAPRRTCLQLPDGQHLPSAGGPTISRMKRMAAARGARETGALAPMRHAIMPMLRLTGGVHPFQRPSARYIGGVASDPAVTERMANMPQALGENVGERARAEHLNFARCLTGNGTFESGISATRRDLQAKIPVCDA